MSFVQPYGYTGDDWFKQPLIWGYSDTVLEGGSATVAVAGLYTFDSTAVPSGEVHYITSVYAANNTTNPTAVVLAVVRGGTAYNFRRVASPGAGNSVENTNPIALGEGDNIRVYIAGCLVNDAVLYNIFGYKMEITQ